MKVLFALRQIDNEPLGVLYLSSMLKRAGHDVRMVVATHADPLAMALEYKPDVMGYSVYSGSQHYYLDLNRRIREKLSVYSVFGGPHPTFFPEMIEEEGVDAVCVGEAEEAMVDLVDCLARGEKPVGVANWWVKDGATIHRNPVRPLNDDLDTIPFPDRQLLYDAAPSFAHIKLKPFMTGRGCPFNCTYCFNHSFFGEIYKGKGKRLRRRSVDNVLAEMNELRAHYPLDVAIFMDDTFVLDMEWFREFAAKYPRAVGVPFWCQVRANLVTDENTALLKEAGCVSVSIGVEAGNDHLRNDLLKRGMSKQQMVDAIRTLRRHGIAVMTTNMVGLPSGSLETDLETLQVNIEARPSYAATFLFQPYPKTQLGEYAVDNDLLTASPDEIGFGLSEKSIIKFKDARERRQIENLQKLFAVAVEWPFLLPVIKQLIKLPPNPLFWLVYKLFKGFTLKTRIHPHKLSLREYSDTIRAFMQVDRA